MKTIARALALALACAPAQAQAPFSQPWTGGTGAWSAKDSIQAGAIVAVFGNIYCDQKGLQWYWRVLIPMAMSALYETYRWASGKQPLTGNVLWAGAGAAGVSLVWRVRF